MALVLKDRIKQQTTTTGTTDAYVLSGSFTGFETFAEIGDGNTTYYCCTDGTNFEIGIGTFTASGTTLARTTILQSSNSDAEVDWQTGTRTIFCTQPAQKAVFLDASNIATFSDDVTFEGASANIVFDKSADEIRFPQDTNVRFGAAGAGLQIYNNSSGGQINNSNSSGNLFIVNQTDDGDIRLSTDNGSGSITTYILCDGSAGEVQLNYYGATKLKTTSTGIFVSGEVAATDLDISGDVDVDGTLEADDITLNGVALGTIATQAADSVDIDGGAIDGVTIGTNSAVTDLRVDRLKFNLNTISNTVTNDHITLNPNGTGTVRLNTDSLRIGDLGADVTLTTIGTGDLTLSTNEGTDTGTIVIADGVDGNISLTPNGTGVVQIDGSNGVSIESGVVSVKNGGTQSEVRLYCESSNAHYAALKAPVHSDLQTSGNTTLTLPAVTTGTLVSTGDSGSVSTDMIEDNAVTGDKLNDIANVSGSYTNADITVDAQGRITAAATGSGGGGGGSASDSFKTIAVTGTAGQSDVVASSSTDTLTFVAGSNMTITTDASTDTITFASSGGGGGGGGITTGKAIAMAMIFG